MNFHPSAKKAIDTAEKEAASKNHEFVTPEHVLKVLLESHPNLYDRFDQAVLVRTLDDYLDKNMTKSKKKPSESAAFNVMLNSAVSCATNAGKTEVDVADLLIGIWNIKCQASAIMRAYKIERNETVMAAQKLKEGRDVEEKGYLGTFCREVVRECREGKHDPIIGRNDEIERTIEVLCRKKKSNPLLRGESGSGKSSVVIGLAQRIASGSVPDAIKDYEIWSVDLGAMIAGCKYRGEFEQRIDGVIKEAVKKPRCILYIDEIHNLVGAGNGGGGALDAANMFRPYLSSGELKVIGVTTFKDYKEIERDGALSRRFQNIDILVPTEKETFDILVGLKASYEKFHNVEYPDETLSLTAKLAGEYVKERALPDSAIDVMDETGARAKVKNYKEGVVGDPIVITEEMIEHVVSRIAKVPAKSVSKDDGERLLNLEKDLKEVVFGQDEAIEKVVVALKRARAGFRKKDKPIANVICAGRSGSGKTWLFKTLADLMGLKLLRWDMSEMSEKNSVAKWIGSAAGYIGYEEGGQLVEQVSKNPHSILLLDEIEKANPEVFNVLLGIMDNATLADSHGKIADFSNVLVAMTSNVGASRIGEKTIGFDENAKTGKTNVDAINQEYEKTFSPEFRNRVDAMIVFNDLTGVELKRIVERELKEFREQLADKNVEIEFTERTYDWLVKNGYDEKLGARPLVRLFEKEVKDRSIDPVLFGDLKEGGKATIDVDGDEEHLVVLTTPQIKSIETEEKTTVEKLL